MEGRIAESETIARTEFLEPVGLIYRLIGWITLLIQSNRQRSDVRSLYTACEPLRLGHSRLRLLAYPDREGKTKLMGHVDSRTVYGTAYLSSPEL